jgi:hypothetical protein
MRYIWIHVFLSPLYAKIVFYYFKNVLKLIKGLKTLN